MRIGVLASGRGSNLAALIAARDQGALASADLALVVCNRPNAAALERAREAGIPAVLVDHEAHADRASFEHALLAVLEEHRVEAVVLAGFMRVLTATFLGAFPERIINTHPSLLPAFPGLAAPAQAIEHGVKVSGCTIHFVEAGVDTGPIIAQRAIEVLPGDDAASLHRRIQALEHELLPQVTALLAAGRLVCDRRRVRIC